MKYLKKWAKQEQEEKELGYWLIVVAFGLWCDVVILLAAA